LTLPDEPLWVEGDSTRLVQVFVNLVNNAVKYTPEGGQISVTAERMDDTAVVKVRDNGIGIPPEMLSRIFGLFTQIDLSSDREAEGLGIGLALVRRLIELHGGSITAQSDGRQRGSVFSVMLPLARVETMQQPPKVGASRPVPGRRVLLIEDNADGRHSLSLLLRMVGHHVTAAADGNRGITAGLENPPEVALVDIGLPDIDGYEVARRLRASIGPNPFLVALTGYSQPEDRERALAAGFDAHLTKPVDLATLQALLAARVGPGPHGPAPQK
jgi:CheY-like chemotaxis protein